VFNSTANVNPTTGIRYGVIAMNSLDQDLAQELWHGPGATDVCYEAAYNDAKAEAERHFAAEHEEAVIACAENGLIDFSDEIDDFIFEWLEAKLGTSDPDEYVENCLEEFSDTYQSDEPTIEGEYEGIKYRIMWLGGAPNLWVIEGPVGYATQLCSLCVPNAANLDAGWNEFDVDSDDNGVSYLHECYILPRDWLYVEPETRSMFG
jgi:hypothetical protein